MLGNHVQRAARILWRIGMGLGAALLCVASTRMELSWSVTASVGLFGLALLMLVALGGARPTLRTRRLLILCGISGGLGGMTLLVAAHLFEVGGSLFTVIGSTLVPIGGAAAGALAIVDPAVPTERVSGWRQLATGTLLLIAFAVVGVCWTTVDWLEVGTWVLPIWVLSVGALGSAARMLEAPR